MLFTCQQSCPTSSFGADVDDATGHLAGGDVGDQRLQVVHARIVRRGRRRHEDRGSPGRDQQHEHDKVEPVAVENPERRGREQRCDRDRPVALKGVDEFFIAQSLR